MKPLKHLVVAALALVVALAVTAVATAQSDDERVVLTVGLTQDLDTPNPTVSELVSSYELNTVRYVDADRQGGEDFATIPGLAESWEGSDDGQTWTYKLRDGLKWSDGKPLTAEDVAYTINRSRDEEWLNHSATTANLDAEATDPTDRGDQVQGAGPEAADDGRLHRPQAHLREDRRRRRSQVRRPRRRRLRPVPARRVQEGPVRALQGQPELLGRQAAARRGRVPRSSTTPDAMVAALKRGEIDAAHDVPGRRVRPARDEDRTSRPSRATRAASTSSPSTAATASRSRTRRCSTRACARRSRHAIDKETIVDRVLRGHRRAGRRRSARPPNPSWMPDIPADQTVRLRPRQGERRCSTRPATRTPTATASARCPAAASR